MSDIDTGIFFLINKSLFCPVLYYLMLFITELGSGEVIAAVSALLIFSRKRENKVGGIILFAGLTIVYYIVHILKDWVARPRPFMSLSGINFLLTETSYSFPSGHTTIAFMAAAVLSSVFRRKATFFILASVVGLSRVYLAMHFPSDVMGGAAIGASIGYMLVNISKRAKILSP